MMCCYFNVQFQGQRVKAQTGCYVQYKNDSLRSYMSEPAEADINTKEVTTV